jgi:hypothetical protein
MKEWSRHDDRFCQILASRLMTRRLFKAIDLGSEVADTFWEEAGEIVRNAGFDPTYYLITDRATDVPYYGYYSTVGLDPKSLIYVKRRSAFDTRNQRGIEVVRGMRGFRIDRVMRACRGFGRGFTLDQQSRSPVSAK